MEPQLRLNTECTIAEWLGSLGMSQYVNNFEENGYDDLDCLWNLSSEDLEQIGVRLAGHRRKLLNHASRLEIQSTISKKNNSTGSCSTIDDADLSYEIWQPDILLGFLAHTKHLGQVPVGIGSDISSFVSNTISPITMDQTVNPTAQNEPDDVITRLEELHLELENDLNHELPIHGRKGVQLDHTKCLFAIEVFDEDLSRSMSVEIEEDMPSWYVTHLLLVQHDLTDSPNWGLIEVTPHLSIQRMLEDHENVASTYKYANENQSLLLLKKDDYKYDLFQRRYEYFPAQLCLPSQQIDEPLDPRLESARRMLIDGYLSDGDCPPELRGVLFLKEGKKSWKQKYIELRASGLYYSRAGRPRHEKHLSLLCCIDNYDACIAANYRKAAGAPSEFCFVLKPRGQILKLGFLDLKCFSAPSKRVMFSWLAGIRLVRHGGALLRDNFISMCDKKRKLELRSDKNKEHEAAPLNCCTQTYLRPIQTLSVSSKYRFATSPNAMVQADHSATTNTSYFYTSLPVPLRPSSQLSNTLLAEQLAAASSSEESATIPSVYRFSHTLSNGQSQLYLTPSEFIIDSNHSGANSSSNVLINPWFHGVISKDESAIRIASFGGADGTFLIRESISRPGSYVLTMIFQQKFYHYIIHNHGSIQNALFAIDHGPRFVKLQDLYQYYSRCSDGMPCRLSQLCLDVSTEVIVSEPL